MIFTHSTILFLFRRIRAVVFCACFTLYGCAWASAVVLPLTSVDMQIQGATAQAAFSINIDAKKDRKTEPTLHLEWRKSRLIDVNRSTLSIVIDGQMKRTVWLKDLGNGKYKVPLPGITGGLHTLVLRANLRIDEDPCLQTHRENAWFTIKSDSTIRWERRINSTTKSFAMPIKQFPEAWQRLADGWSGVHLKTHNSLRKLDEERSSAYLEASHLLRRWGYQPQNESTLRTVGQLHLLTASDLGLNSESVKRFAQTPSLSYIISSGKENELSIIGRDPSGLRDGILLLADDVARAFCNDSICEGGTSPGYPIPKNPDAPPSKTVPKLDSTKVWDMNQTEFSKGWIARGEGTHQLKFIWQRPATWSIKPWPTLHLHGQASSASNIDLNSSVVNVRLNNRPLASYPLAQWQTHRSEVRIPTEMWSADQWVFEISVNLKTKLSGTCVAINDDSLWFTVGTDTRLLVPRLERNFDSVGRFYSDFLALGKLPELHTSTFDTLNLEATANVLYPFYAAQFEKNKRPPRWQWASEQTCQAQRCIQLLQKPREGALLNILDGHWQSTPNGLNLPHVPTAGSMAIFYQAATSSQGAQLYIVPGLPTTEQRADAIEPPDYSGLLGRIALFSQRWLSLDIQPMSSEGALIGEPNLSQNPLDEKSLSKEQTGLRWLNFIWAGLSVLILGIVIFRLWRKPKNKNADDNWEMHDQ